MYQFICGTESWECLVDVKLTDDEAALLKEHAQKNDFIDWFPPLDRIWSKVMLALEEQCDDDADLDNVTIRVPVGMRDV